MLSLQIPAVNINLIRLNANILKIFSKLLRNSVDRWKKTPRQVIAYLYLFVVVTINYPTLHFTNITILPILSIFCFFVPFHPKT